MYVLGGLGDASDANDAEQCIISSSGDYLDCLLTRGGSSGRAEERGVVES